MSRMWVYLDRWTSCLDLADRTLPGSIDELVIAATGRERLPELGWNISGYIAHMTDNTRIWAERLIAVARGADARTSFHTNQIYLPSPGATTTLLSKERRGRFGSFDQLPPN